MDFILSNAPDRPEREEEIDWIKDILAASVNPEVAFNSDLYTPEKLNELRARLDWLTSEIKE